MARNITAIKNKELLFNEDNQIFGVSEKKKKQYFHNFNKLLLSLLLKDNPTFSGGYPPRVRGVLMGHVNPLVGTAKCKKTSLISR